MGFKLIIEDEPFVRESFKNLEPGDVFIYPMIDETSIFMKIAVDCEKDNAVCLNDGTIERCSDVDYVYPANCKIVVARKS